VSILVIIPSIDGIITNNQNFGNLRNIFTNTIYNIVTQSRNQSPEVVFSVVP
jgi:hypothetical protein